MNGRFIFVHVGVVVISVGVDIVAIVIIVVVAVAVFGARRQCRCRGAHFGLAIFPKYFTLYCYVLPFPPYFATAAASSYWQFVFSFTWNALLCCCCCHSKFHSFMTELREF